MELRDNRGYCVLIHFFVFYVKGASVRPTIPFFAAHA
jgi:hypothetical protein